MIPQEQIESAVKVLCKNKKALGLPEEATHLDYAEKGFRLGIAFAENHIWHDLSKDPNDLPTYTMLCWCADGSDEFIAHYVKDSGFKTIGSFGEVIAWMELPEFKEE